MPVPGRPPKPDGQARHRGRPVHDWLEVPDVPFDRGPKLPRQMPNGAPWPAWVKRWWTVLSSMPHCKTWAPSDWQFAFDTAFIKARFAQTGMASLARELRARERVLGTTADYRRSLRIRYVASPPGPETGAEVSHLDDYRNL